VCVLFYLFLAKRKRIASLVTALFLDIALGCLAYHLLTFNYGISHDEPLDSQSVLVPSLRILGQGASGPTAEFSLSNTGHCNVRLVDTSALSPLYQITLSYSVAGAVPQTVRSKVIRVGPELLVEPGEKRTGTSIVELVPGSTLTKRIDLPSLFDIRRQGTYRMEVTYQPGNMVSLGGTEFAGCHASPLIAAADFTIPQKQSP
jgi:hypothetical protein